jgi:hypothetical protein
MFESWAPILSHWKNPIGCCLYSTIGPRSDSQHKNKLASGSGKNGIQYKTSDIKQNENYEKSQELKGQSEN